MNKLVDQYDNMYHCSIGKKLVDSNYSGLTEEIKSSHKVAKFTIGDKVRITNYKNFSIKVTPNVGKEKYLLLTLY